MKKIKTWLIHMLGGLTVQESQESDANSWEIGHYMAFAKCKQMADKLYGCDAEAWSEAMYRYVEHEMKKLEHE